MLVSEFCPEGIFYQRRSEIKCCVESHNFRFQHYSVSSQMSYCGYLILHIFVPQKAQKNVKLMQHKHFHFYSSPSPEMLLCSVKIKKKNMGIRRISMSINLGVRQNLWASMPQIDVQTGVKHGNPANSQVEKSGSPPAILGVRMPGLPLILYTAPVCQ